MMEINRQTPKKVLVVDDEPGVLYPVSAGLKRHGYDVTAATSGDQALEWAWDHRFDLVLCDLHLHDVDGIKLAQNFGKMYAQTPVIVMTASGDIDEIKQAFKVGASDYIAKPIDVDNLPLIFQNNIQRKKLKVKLSSEGNADVMFQMVQAMANAVDNKSAYTRGHSNRVAEICCEIGKEMGLPQERLSALQLAAYIHDLGMIGLPDSILDKSGELSDEDKAEFLKHPQLGASILDGIDELSEVANIVLHHHEHVNGRGYPDRLKGESIPLLARILSVADSFEAMTSERPYSSARSREETLSEMRKYAGIQWDPIIVSAMIRVAERMNSDIVEAVAAA